MKRFWLQVWLERGVHVGDHEARLCFHVSVMRLSDCPIDPPRTHYVQVSPRGHIHRSVLQQTPRSKVFLLAQSVAKSHLSRSHDLKNQKKIQKRWKCCLNAVYISLIKYPEADCRVCLSTESTCKYIADIQTWHRGEPLHKVPAREERTFIKDGWYDPWYAYIILYHWCT